MAERQWAARVLEAYQAQLLVAAEAPEGVGEQKYDASAASMIALLRYGSGFPWNRLEGLQDSLGMPLPAATQCEIVAETAAMLQPAYEELIRQAAQGEVLHNDDTSMRVLALNKAQTPMLRMRHRSGREYSRVGSYRLHQGVTSRYSSLGISTPARIWPMC